MKRILASLTRRKEADARAAAGKKPLGVQVADLTEQVAQLLGLSSARGAIIAVVAADSVASKAGLKPGDVLLSLDGTVIESTKGLQQVVANVAAGRVVDLRVVRARQELTLSAEF